MYLSLGKEKRRLPHFPLNCEVEAEQYPPGAYFISDPDISRRSNLNDMFNVKLESWILNKIRDLGVLISIKCIKPIFSFLLPLLPPFKKMRRNI